MELSDTSSWAQGPIMENHSEMFTNSSVGPTGNHVNSVYDSDYGGGGSFFDTYFSVPRFATETTLGALSVLSNALSLTSFNYVYGRQTAYHILFLNLAIANILSTIIAWVCNNSFFLFQEQMMNLMSNGSSICELFIYLLAAVFASSAFALVSTLTMLGFTTVQYFAVCRPLHHSSIVRKRRICIFIFLSWFISLICACLPFFILLGIIQGGACDEAMLGNILLVVIIGTDVSIGVVVLTYFSIVALCLRIYSEIKKLKKRLSQFRFDHEVSGERKAFVTIIILLSTLTIFVIPYAAVYVITLNFNNNSGLDMQNDVLIYYMNLLPYLKFLTDPIIYGMRMREVREGWSRMMLTCGIHNCSCSKHEFTLVNVPQTTTSVVSMPAVHSTSV